MQRPAFRAGGRRAPRLAAAVVGAIVAAGTAGAATMPGAENVSVRTLPNGMRILVWPDHDLPSVALYTWFKVGSRNERPGLTGISHFFEHMMFNGTKTRPPGELDRTMEGHGGSNNASTSSDVTIYQDWFPSSMTELAFELEADRMRNLDFDPKKVESERDVVYSERRSSIDDDGFGTLLEQVQATAYVAHPYQIPTIGWPSDIESWTLADLQDWYKRYYAPNNAVMVVTGDVTPEQAYALADKYFAPIPAQPAPPPVTAKEPPQLGERRITVVREAQAPLLAMAWHASAAADHETRVLEVVLAILGGGESSRLYRRLVDETQAAVDVGTSLDEGFDPGLAWVYAVVPPGGDVAHVETLVDEEIARLAKDGPRPEELQKARNQALSGFWHGLETTSGKAGALGNYEVLHGDWRKLFDAASEYDGLTAEDVRKAAAEVLVREHRTVGVLQPGLANPPSMAEQGGAP